MKKLVLYGMSIFAEMDLEIINRPVTLKFHYYDLIDKEIASDFFNVANDTSKKSPWKVITDGINKYCWLFSFPILKAQVISDTNLTPDVYKKFRYENSSFRTYMFPYFNLIDNMHSILGLVKFDYYTAGNIFMFAQIIPLWWQYICHIGIHELGHAVAYFQTGVYYKLDVNDKAQVNYDVKIDLDFKNVFNSTGVTSYSTDQLSTIETMNLSSAGMVAGLESSRFFFLRKMLNKNYLGIASNIGLGVIPFYTFLSYYKGGIDIVNSSNSVGTGDQYNPHNYVFNANEGHDVLSMFGKIKYIQNHQDTYNTFFNRMQKHIWLNFVNTRVIYCACNFFYNLFMKKNIDTNINILFQLMPAMSYYLTPLGEMYRFSILTLVQDGNSLINIDFDYVKPYDVVNTSSPLNFKLQILNLVRLFENIIPEYFIYRISWDMSAGIGLNQKKLKRQSTTINTVIINQIVEEPNTSHIMLFTDGTISFLMFPFGGRFGVKLNLFYEMKDQGYYPGKNLNKFYDIYLSFSIHYFELFY